MQLRGAGSWALRSWVMLRPRFTMLALPLARFGFLFWLGWMGGGIVALQLEVWSGNNGTKELLYKVPIQARVCLPCCSSAPCSQSWESWLSRAFSCSLLCSLLALSPSLYEEPASFGWPGGAERLHRASAHPSLSAVGTSEFVLLRLQGRKMQRGNLGTKVAAGHPLLECPGHTPDT